MGKTKTLRTPTIRKSARGGIMATILRDVPPTYNWGWYSREDPRMHLQPVDHEHRRLGYKVWLEHDGHRVMEPEPGIPARVWRSLQAQISKQRAMIEDHWVGLMIYKDWLGLHVAPPQVTLVAYPGFPHRFVRTLDLHDYIGNPEVLAKVTPTDVVFNTELAMLEIFPKREEGRRLHIDLTPILWE